MMWNVKRALARWLPRSTDAASEAPSDEVRRVVAHTSFELVPLKNLAAQLPDLPPGAHVSVTCSPVKGLDATIDLAAQLQASGFHATPHIAARLVRNAAHVSELSARFREAGFEEIFVIAGDEETPTGDYDGALPFLRDLLAESHGLLRIGVAAYPDGHVFLEQPVLRQALHAKQAVFAEAGIDGWASTQMCFDASTITRWLRAERTVGLRLPVRLGIPGPVDRTKLLTMGMKVGVGQSLRYLKKNRPGLFKLMTGTSYDPGHLLASMGGDLDGLGVVGLHLFTFNQLGGSVSWQQSFASEG